MSNVVGITRSVCPICLKTVEAQKIEHHDGIYMHKTCDLHGVFSTLIWQGDFASYQAWQNKPSIAPEMIPDCPHTCLTCRDHPQSGCCVLLEVTDRCNLRCPVCFASAGETPQGDQPLCDFEHQFDRLMELGGPFNIQLSGGEPTMRDDLPEIIRMGKKKGFSFFQLNTNGIRLAQETGYAESLKSAGLDTVFLQFDGLTSKSHEILRGKNLLAQKQKAIIACQQADLGVVLVPTLKRSANMDEIGAILDFAFDHMPAIRGVHFQPISYFGRFEVDPDEVRITLPEVLREIEKQTEGRLRAGDFSGGGAEDAYCSFHGRFIREDNKIRAMKPKPASCCSSSKQSREFVAQHWRLPEKHVGGPSLNSGLIKADSLDHFLHTMETQILEVSGMVFQDADNLDLQRLQKCYIGEFNGEVLIPFCAYNLTNRAGKSLYRSKGKPL